MQISEYIDNARIANRLMELARKAEARRNGKKVDESSETESQKDEVILSGNTPAEATGAKASTTAAENTQINLGDLIAKLKELYANSSKGNVQVQANVTQTVQIEASFSYSVLEKVEGLVRNSNNSAETDRYLFEFQDGVTFKITDKWTNRSTTVWGDPHVDVNDMEGNYDGDFKDMTASNSQTTFMLQDATRVTFTAKDDGLIEKVDIFKGYQHLEGIGQGSTEWTDDNNMFASAVDTNTSKALSLNKGDTVVAGGDGNDWYTVDGELLWGQTTGPVVTSRPSAVWQMSYKETVTTEASIQVNTQA
jgi:hypothetical protein